MILPLLLQAVPPSEADIVVLAERMRMIEVDIKAPKRDGRLVIDRCRVTKPSGNAELDAVPCAAARACVAEPMTSRRALERCVDERSQPILDAIVARWRAARTPA